MTADLEPPTEDPTGPASARAVRVEPRLDRKRLFTAFLLTPMLAGFYPAIFLGEPSIMPIGLVLSYASAAVFGIPLVIFFDRQRVRDW